MAADPVQLETRVALEVRPSSGYCDRDLPPNATEARISGSNRPSRHCAEGVLMDVRPNCGGGSVPRPIRRVREWRPGQSLTERPASTKRIRLS